MSVSPSASPVPSSGAPVLPMKRGAALVAAWDIVIRACCVLVAWVGLRRPTPLRRLASIGHPRRFVRAAIVPAGRHFALAIAFLPRARRDEATVSFLICKALDAFEDLSADRAAARAGIAAAADYLTGRTVRPPLGTGLVATRDSDRLEALLAARLPMLRVALEALPPPAMERGRALIDRIAAGMLRASADRRCYADDVLGEAVAFAAEVAAPDAAAPRIACRAAGRALQLANDLRDADTDRARAIALYQALPELPIVPRLLRWLPAAAGAGARAAATLLVVTTCAFYLHQLGRQVRVPPLLRHPLRAALAAARSRRAYLGTVAAIEAVLREALLAVAGASEVGLSAARSMEAGMQVDARSGAEAAEGEQAAAALDAAIPAGTSEPVASAATLISLAMELVHAVPARRLDAQTSEQPGQAVVLADHLLFAAIDRLSDLDADSFVHVAALLERLAAPADRAELSRSTALAEFAAATSPREVG